MKISFLVEAEVTEPQDIDTYRVSIKSNEDAYFDAINATILDATPAALDSGNAINTINLVRDLAAVDPGGMFTSACVIKLNELAERARELLK